MLNRRGFLSFLGAAVASATLDPERLLWVPGAKVYSLPSVRVATNAEMIAAQMEVVRPNLEQLMECSAELWERISMRDMAVSSPRPHRIPIQPLKGGSLWGSA